MAEFFKAIIFSQLYLMQYPCRTVFICWYITGNFVISINILSALFPSAISFMMIYVIN